MIQYIADAFTDTLFAGNPAAVLPCREMPEADLKWFTPGGEVALCHGNDHEYTYMGSSGTYWSATSGEHEMDYTFIFTDDSVNDTSMKDYYYGTPIRAVFSID
jgi:predicted PhzF superfamily epimerase YddE/YHI9